MCPLQTMPDGRGDLDARLEGVMDEFRRMMEIQMGLLPGKALHGHRAHRWLAGSVLAVVVSAVQ